MGSLENENLFTYAGTSGVVNRQTSIDREEYERISGETKERARRFLNLIKNAEDHGLTWKELQIKYRNVYQVELHHGQISGLLTNLHRMGKVFIYSGKKRDNCYAYIHSEYKEYFPEDLRYDTPVQTKAGIRKAAFEELLAGLRKLSEQEERLSYSEYSETVNELIDIFDFKTTQ